MRPIILYTLHSWTSILHSLSLPIYPPMEIAFYRFWPIYPPGLVTRAHYITFTLLYLHLLLSHWNYAVHQCAHIVYCDSDTRHETSKGRCPCWPSPCHWPGWPGRRPAILSSSGRSGCPVISLSDVSDGHGHKDRPLDCFAPKGGYYH